MALEKFAWKDRPALIERLFPAGKVSAESFKEQMAGSGKTLTVFGSYWKGRKPLVLNKACILASLLPASETPEGQLRDLETFELLMGMDDEAMRLRIAARLPVRRASEAEVLVETLPFREQVETAVRAEEMDEETLYGRIWKRVNAHLGTSASSFSELVQEMGEARFGHRPKVADVFCGSGQIPFEAARLGCDVYASDLNPVACMLTWGAFNVVGAGPKEREAVIREQKSLVESVQKIVDGLGVEDDGHGWKAKAYLYCVETKCPETGWMVPMLPTLVVSKPRTGIKNNVCLKLVPDPENRRYDFEIVQFVKDADLPAYEAGTVRKGYLVHSPDGVREHRISIKAIRGDYRDGGETKNRLRLWEKTDIVPRPDDVYQERLFCVQWAKRRGSTARYDYEFRTVTDADLERERKVEDFVRERLAEWQEKGFIPDMVIEKGDETERLYRERGWTHWHHLFCPRHLLLAGLVNSLSKAGGKFGLANLLDWNSRLSTWVNLDGGGGSVKHVFCNQALNTTFVFGCRTTLTALPLVDLSFKDAPLPAGTSRTVRSSPADRLDVENDVYVTDPPYGDAVKYEEITEFFIAWLRKNPPEEFAGWTWDSRRVLAIKGEDEFFRQAMIRSYSTMRDHMPDNGIQIMMFTHKSGSIWADMANIIWASGLQVTAAWCVATETDSALRQGANIKSTVLLVLRKRTGTARTHRGDLGDEIADAVQEQVEALTGLDQKVRERRSEGLYADADLQMAGYAAALKILTSYSVIDGRDMAAEAMASRSSDGRGLVEDLISFAEQTAVQYLVPSGFSPEEWRKLQPIERFYLKMAEMEARGEKSLDNYQRFAKAFKVQHYELVMSKAARANAAHLKLAPEFKGTFMSAGSAEIAGTPLRALLYAAWELEKDDGADVDDAVAHLMDNCPGYHANRPLLVKMAGRLAEERECLKDTKTFKPKAEAEAFRILAEALGTQKV